MTKRRQSASRQDAQAAAEHLAIAALGFIAGEPERLGRFLAITGIGPDSIRAAAREPQFPSACSITSRPTSRCCLRLRRKTRSTPAR